MQNRENFLRFHDNNSYVNAPQCCVRRTLSLLYSMIYNPSVLIFVKTNMMQIRVS